MELSCPHCGTVTEVPDLLIPTARLTTTCTRCGAKIGGTVPPRAGSAGRLQRQAGGRVSKGSGRVDRDDAPFHRSKGSGAGKRRERGARGPIDSRPEESADTAHDGPAGSGSRSRDGSGREYIVRPELDGPAREDAAPRRTRERNGQVGGADRRAGEDTRFVQQADDRESGQTQEAAGDRIRAAGKPAAGGPELGPTQLRVVAKGLDPERLARLVASDMLLYNRGKVEKTAEEGRLLSSMAAEIAEAWEFYKGRVGDPTAKGTSYFRDAINNILAGGNPIL